MTINASISRFSLVLVMSVGDNCRKRGCHDTEVEMCRHVCYLTNRKSSVGKMSLDGGTSRR